MWGVSIRGRAGPRVIKQQLQGLDNLIKMRVVFSKTGAAQCRSLSCRTPPRMKETAIFGNLFPALEGVTQAVSSLAGLNSRSLNI